MILLDTHVLVWDALAPDRLSTRARQAIAAANQGDGMMVCDISLWEVAMLVQKGRVHVAADCQTFISLVLQANKITVQAITPQIAAMAAQFSDEINKDPADRLIAATAIAANIPLVTADRNLQSSGALQIIW